MLWAHRPNANYFNSSTASVLCFALLLIVFLMILNVIGHIKQYKTRQIEYRQQVSTSLERLKKNSNNLYNLVGAWPRRT